MLYFRALEKGLSKLPQINSKIRDMIKKDLFEKGIEFLYSQLKMVDPNISKRIHKNDTQRITRALEVFQQTGQPLSEFQKKSLKQKMPYRAIKFARMPENRESLYKSIDSRFEKMLSIGFEDEVKRLIDRGDLNAEMPSMRAVGYRQMWDYLHGHCSYGEMVKKGQAASRQLAKRQMTWLRSELNTNWLDNFNKNSISKVEKKLKI